MKGHWHLENKQLNQSNSDEKAILNYYDQYGVWNEKIELFWGGFSVHLDNWNNKILITNAECYHEEYYYSLKSDSLILLNLNNEVVYNGYKCQNECCNKEEDYFLLTGLDIKLPFKTDTLNCKKLTPFEKGTFNKIFIGKDRENGNWKFDFGFNLTKTNKISQWLKSLEDTYKFKSEDKHSLILYIDSKVSKKMIGSILDELRSNGVDKVFFALKSKNKHNSELEVWLIEKRTDTTNLKSNFSYQNWINAM